MTEEIDLTDHHPCPVCCRVLTDQPLCHYCAETAALRKDLFDANMRATIDKADAERYRWLRKESLIHWERSKNLRNKLSFPTLRAFEPKPGGNYRDRFDAAIDAVREDKP